MAELSASRTVISTISVPSGISGSAALEADAESAGAIIGSGAVTAAPVMASAGLTMASPPPATSVPLDDCSPSELLPLSPDAADEASSPSAASTAMTVFTFTPSVPSATLMAATVPSSTASTSMVALSVSISAMMSPDDTSSPSFTSHLASLPSSMVGDRAGIRISVGIGQPSLTRPHTHRSTAPTHRAADRSAQSRRPR
jgi:hypothetical protein